MTPSGLEGLKGWLLIPLKSPLPVLLKAWLIVSMVSSPPFVGGCAEIGLPSGCLRGESSTPLIDADLLVGGVVPKPCDDTGDRTGEGDLYPGEERELSPAT